MNDRYTSSTTNDGDTATTIRVRRGRRELVAVADMIWINEQVFRLDSVEQVAYSAAARVNQASYTIGLGQGGIKRTFVFDAYRHCTELEDARAIWGQLVSLLEATACPRVAQDAALAISAGSTVTFGARPATRIDGDSEGLRPHKPFSRKVPWAQITRAESRAGRVRVWTRNADGRTPAERPKMSVDMVGWNAVVLPRVVAALAGR